MSGLRRRLYRAGVTTVLVAASSGCTVESRKTSSEGADAGSPGSSSSAQAGAAGARGDNVSETGGASGVAGTPEGTGAASQGGAAGSGPNASTAGEPGSSAAAGSGPTPSCEQVGENGTCAGEVLEYCAAGKVVHVDCAAVGATCAVEDAVADCADVQRAAGCGDLTELGICDGDMIRYCDETGNVPVARVINCAAYGQTCDATAGKDGGTLCVPHGTCPKGVDEDGVCDKNELSFCEDAQLYVFDCGVDVCSDVDGFSDCYAKDIENGCGSATAAGICAAGRVERCLGNVVTREDCQTLGLECVQDDDGASCRHTDCPANCVSGYECTDGLCVPETTPDREWTVAVYSVADNNLSDALWRDLNEMEAVGSDADVQIVAEIGFSSEYSNVVPDQYRSDVYRMVVERDDDRDSSASLDGATKLGDDVDMGTSAPLTAFLQWAAENYPARKMALIMANHGGGYQGGFYDEGADDAMSLRDMVAGVRDSAVHLDLLGMDACMMGMHEVGMAFRGVADTLVASEDPEPGGGYPYTDILSALANTPTLTAAELGETVVDNYTAAYDNARRSESVSMAATDLSKLPALNEQLATFTETALTQASGMRGAIKQAVSSADLLRAEATPSITDIGSILTVFSGMDGPVGRTAGDVDTWLAESGPVLSARGTGTKDGTSGLGIYLPQVAWSQSSDYTLYWLSTSFLPLQPWFAFVGNLSSAEAAVAEPGEGAVDSFSVVLSWGNEPNGTESTADLDLYVYEPSGEFGTPANGATTQNGLLSGDSYDTEVPTESYTLKSVHQGGKYTILVNLYDIEVGDKAYPRLQIYRDDLPGGVRTLIRGKVVDRELVEIPLDDSHLLKDVIDRDNLQDVLNLDYSNLWFATTIEVLAVGEEETDAG